MAEDRAEAENLAPVERNQRLISGDTKVTFTLAQLITLYSAVVIICTAIGFLMYFYFDTKSRLDKSDQSLVDINEKLDQAAVSSGKYRKLETDVERLKDSDKEIRAKVFK